MTYQQAMRRALLLALKGSGFVSPNPRVGAIILKNEKIIGEGWHQKFGGKHAEVEAVENAAGVDLEGTTLVVNLEPCMHFGKTPPCTKLLIEKKFSRVVIGMLDPNPIVSGRGAEELRNAGIDVVTGILEQDSKWVNRFFIKHISTGKPYVVLKVAQSLDGCIATSTGESKWITCPESRRRAHMLRAEIDAVLIGKNTAMADNPKLTVRDVKGRNPMRIIFDTNLSLPIDLNLLSDENRDRTIICCGENAGNNEKEEFLINNDVKILKLPCSEDGKPENEIALERLSEDFGVTSIFVEGGAEIYSSFLSKGLVDEIHLFIAPQIIGSGIKSFGSYSIAQLELAAKFEYQAISKSGSDLHVIGVEKHYDI